jgi:DNA polymerase zeta
MQVLAYNLCYSTCLGKLTKGVSDPRGPTTGKLGFATFPAAKSAAGVAACLASGGGSPDDLPFVSPTGAMFCRPATRVGVLPRMLREILETRFMVKRAMKRCLGTHLETGNPLIGDPSKRRTLENVLHARQFALKMIANVTYGYTAASFTGRMPCAELADAIVKAGRHTLEHAIAMVEAETTKWSGASVSRTPTVRANHTIEAA